MSKLHPDCLAATVPMEWCPNCRPPRAMTVFDRTYGAPYEIGGTAEELARLPERLRLDQLTFRPTEK